MRKYSSHGIYLPLLVVMILCFLPAKKVSANDILVINPENKITALGEYLEIYQDTVGELTIEDISSGKYDDDFFRNQNESLNLGLSNAVFWLRFTLQLADSEQTDSKELLLDLGTQYIFYADLYFKADIENNNKWFKQQRGALKVLDESEFVFHNVVFELPDLRSQPQTFYLRLESKSPYFAHLRLIQEDALNRSFFYKLIFFGVFYGLMLGLLFYNLFLFVILRDKARLYYLLYLLGAILYFLSVNRFTTEVLFRNNPIISTYMTLFCLGFFAAMAILFAQSLLSTRELLPSFNRILNILIIMSLSLSIGVLFIDYSIMINYSTFLGLTIPVFLLIVGIAALVKGHQNARFYILASFSVMVGTVIFALSFRGILPYNAFTFYSLQTATAIEAIFLSLALADRINTLNKRLELALQEADLLNRKLKNYGDNLEMLVSERTQKLSLANKKLQELDLRKTETLYMVTHDLRTPMTSILGFAHLITQRYQSVIVPALEKSNDKKVIRTTKQILANIIIIEEEGKRLTNLINNFLDLSKLEEGKVDLNRETTDLEELINIALGAVNSLLTKKKLDTYVDVAAEIPKISADREKLIQVLINLLSNAIKFTADGGSITCRVAKHNSQLTVSIIDTGRGMTKEEQEQAFEKFKQVGKQDGTVQKGTGLGLPICKQIIEMHGGKIWVASEPGQGSTFSFSLPVNFN